MSAILITGSEGLIGKTLYRRLQHVIPNIKKLDKNLPLDHPGHGDITNPQTFWDKIHNCKGIIHLAGVSRVIWGEKNPTLCWQTNVEGTRHILEAAFSSPHKPWVIYASSREVYGQQSEFPVPESAFLQPMNIYAKSKVAAEQLVEEYRLRGLNTAILRFSSVYGRTDDHADRVIPAFCKAASLGKTLRVEGFENVFDFTHVGDVVEGITKVILKLEKENVLPTLHFTTGKTTTLKQAAEIACQFSKKNADFIEFPSRNFDVSKFYGDPSLAKKTLDWAPTIDISTGIAQMVNAFEKTACFEKVL